LQKLAHAEAPSSRRSQRNMPSLGGTVPTIILDRHIDAISPNPPFHPTGNKWRSAGMEKSRTTLISTSSWLALAARLVARRALVQAQADGEIG